MGVRKSPVRALGADEVPEPKNPMTLAEAIESGVYLEILLAQRRDIAASLPNLSGPALPAQHRLLANLSKEIEQLQSRDSDESEGGANVEDGKFDAQAI